MPVSTVVKVISEPGVDAERCESECGAKPATLRYPQSASSAGWPLRYRQTVGTPARLRDPMESFRGDAFEAFVQEHQRCDVLDGGVDNGYVWLQCSCGGLIMHPAGKPPQSAPTAPSG